MIEDSHEGNAGHGFIEIQDGFKILRQLTSEELKIPPADPITTPEGFVLRGMTDPEVILGLTKLRLLDKKGQLTEPVEIDILESRLRPYKDNPEIKGLLAVERLSSHGLNTKEQHELERLMLQQGVTREGYIAEDQSLLPLLAQTTSSVSGMNLTHQELAEFLFYFGDASSFATRQTGIKPERFEYNGRLFTYEKGLARTNMIHSPFFDGDIRTSNPDVITNLTDEISISVPPRRALWINRYGFYGNGLEPRKIAEVAGFVPKQKT